MTTWYLVLVAVVTVWVSRGSSVPCLPRCRLQDDDHRCDSVVIARPCTRNKDRIAERVGSDRCSCQWAEVLTHRQYHDAPGHDTCLQYCLRRCATRVNLEIGNTDYSTKDFLREIEEENARIKTLTDEAERRRAKIRLVNVVRGVVDKIKLLDKDIDRPKGSKRARNRQTTVESAELDSDLPFEDVWMTRPVTTKRPLKMWPLKNNDKFIISVFAGVVGVIVLFIILGLLAKIKTDRTGVNLGVAGDLELDKRRKKNSCWNAFLEKLRIRYREKAIENERTGKAQPKVGKPPLMAPSKTSIGRKTSNTSVRSDVSSRPDSCTMISGLTHANSSGSDAESDEECRIFQAHFKGDFRSLLNVNKEEN